MATQEDEVRNSIQSVLHRNPEAGALLWAMQLQAKLAADTSGTFRALYEAEQRRSRALADLLDYWMPLGQRYLELRRLLASDEGVTT